MKELFDEFALDARERLDAVQGLLLDIVDASAASWPPLLARARRELHTLKGNAGMMGLSELQALAHEAESLLEGLAPASAAPCAEALLGIVDRFRHHLEAAALGAGTDATPPPSAGAAESADAASARKHGGVRVSFSSLDELVGLVAETVIARNRLAECLASADLPGDRGPAQTAVTEAYRALAKTLGLVQEQVFALRMVPLRTLFEQLRRLVHEEARRTDKRVRWEVRGGEAPVDKALLEVAAEALGHLVRNAVIHGIETPAARLAAGKGPEGRVALTAAVREGELRIDIEDDGAGMAQEALVAAAAVRGHRLTARDDVLSLAFLPGVSTHGGTDMGAGRGVGLSAARVGVERVGGRIAVASAAGQGCRFSLQLPLSVSITDALLVRADGEEYAIPLGAIVESIRFEPRNDHEINHAGAHRWRGRLISLLDLGVAFGLRKQRRDSGFVVVVRADGKVRGLVGDDLTGIREIVVTALDPITGPPRGVSGATILGDGRVVLILDPRGVMALRPFVPSAAPDADPGAASA
ncbi:MAG: chemotaxis protein CheW [Myxococcales bacterium]|nr:chemotaxis protein CheW [Myxococcales bacterium]